MRFLLPALLAILLGALAYQVPARATIDIGGLGDRLFVSASEAQRAEQIARGDWYADQLSPEGRSRWSRERGLLRLPGIGQGHAVELNLYLAGWPADTLRGTPDQPTVDVLVGERVVASFKPGPDTAAFPVTIPAAAQSDANLDVVLAVTPTFTSTQTVNDARPKGVRLDRVEVVSGGPGTQPAWPTVAGLGLLALLATGMAASRTRRSWLVLLAGSAAAVVGGTALILARLWLAAALPGLLGALALITAIAGWRVIVQAWRSVRLRWPAGHALDVGLVVGAVLLALYMFARLWLRVPARGVEAFELDGPERFFEVLVRVSAVGAVLLALVLSVTLLPRWLLALRRALLTTRLAAVVVGLGAGIWIGYMTWLIRVLPFVGHADYADNAVVARNLLRGRGYVVDYVSQFYDLVPGGSVTRPQETWPLLQPLLMQPAMWLFGPTPFAARLPNVALLAALTLLIYHIGATIWDRRVGLLGVVLTLTNILFFRLAIYATSDLALVVWSMAAFWLVFRGVENQEPRTQNPGAAGSRQQAAGKTRQDRFGSRFLVRGSSPSGARFLVLGSSWLWAGVFTGLMVLQKPSAAIFAVGMGLWVLWRTWRETAGATVTQRGRGWLGQWLRPLALWVAVTVVVMLPYIVRNLMVFGQPFFSTEAYDAWVLYFRGTRSEAWEDIYKIYATALGGPGYPDRSWILRWGWDLTLGKLQQQAVDAWQFFAPPKGTLLSPGSRISLPWGIGGTWLMLLGLAVLRRRPRSLIGLVLAALVPYTLFLILYWHVHDEPRYFVPFVPWMALVAAWAACWLFDRIAAVGRGRWAGVGGLVVSATLLLSIQPHWQQIDKFLDPASGDFWGKDWRADLEAYAWLRENTPADAVVMTRVPWQLNFHADRPAVMIPNAGGDEIMQLARYYGASYLLVNGSSTSLPESGGALRALAQGQPPAGWTLEHQVPDQYQGATVYIYRFPADYAGAASIPGGRR